MNVSDTVWAILADHGIERVYALVGGGCMFLADSLARQERIKTIFMHHEQSCGVAAIGDSIYTNKPSACLVTTGPGSTNIVTALASAWVDSVPLIVVAGQVPSHMMMRGGERQGGPQEAPISRIARPVTKLAHDLMEPKHTVFWMNTLINLALNKPSGPVLLSIPLDIQSHVV